MSIFRNKILTKIIAVLCIIVTITSIGMPNKVYAEDEVWGGILITPITKLLISIADGIISIMQHAAMDQEITIIELSGLSPGWNDFGKKLLIGLLIALVVIVVVAASIATAGGFAAFAAGGAAAAMAGLKAAGVAALSFVAIGAVDYAVFTFSCGEYETTVELVAEEIQDDYFDKGALHLPVFSLTPEEIFSNQISLLDINFFNPNSYGYRTEIQTKRVEYYTLNETGQTIYNPQEGWKIESTLTQGEYNGYVDYELDANDLDIYSLREYFQEGLHNFLDGYQYDMPVDFKQALIDGVGTDTFKKAGTIKILKYIAENINTKLGATVLPTPGTQNYDNYGPLYWQIRYADGTYDENPHGYREIILGFYYLNTEKTFEVKVISDSDENDVWGSIEISVIGGITKNIGSIQEEVQVENESTAKQLSKTIAKWYFTLRNLALLVLMVVLIYIGIRIVIGSTAGEKAKYKERLMDWLVAMCLLFVMHYIMVFAIEGVDKITGLITTIVDGKGIAERIPLQEEHIQNLQSEEFQETLEYQMFNQLGLIIENDDDTKDVVWITNIMGRMRIMAQTTAEGTAGWVGYALCYIVLVIETLFFLWTYIKRVLYMAFLTIIAPLVAMTYPIDKITDGKAQAFSAWLKEYIFNLLIQPLHLLLYTVLILSAYNLALFNPLYAIVAVGFMVPAENLMRKFFGFTKAQTAGALGGAAGAALAFTGLQKVMSLGKRKGGSKKEKDTKDKNKIRFAKSGGADPKQTVADKMQGKKTKSDVIGDGAGAGGEGTGGAANPLNPSAETSNGAPKPENGAKKETSETMAPEEKNKKAKRGNIIKAGWAAGKRYKRMLGKKVANRIKKMKPIRSLARGVTGVAGAATFGMAGLALGIASGDASKAFQYTTAGATGGFAAGKGLAGTVTDALSVDTSKIKDEMEMTYFGEDYKQHKFDESVKEMAEDSANIDTIRQLTGLSEEDAEKMLKTVGRSCYESGITDMEDIAAVHKMEKEGYSREEAIAALKFNQYLPSDLNKMGESDRSDHIDRWAREYEEAGYENPETLAQESMRLAEVINKIKSGLKKA